MLGERTSDLVSFAVKERGFFKTAASRPLLKEVQKTIKFTSLEDTFVLEPRTFQRMLALVLLILSAAVSSLATTTFLEDLFPIASGGRQAMKSNLLIPNSAFTPGNLAVCRLGTGAPLGNSSTAVFIDEYTPAGMLVQSIALPTAVSGSNQILTMSGTATTECQLNRSSDGRYLLLIGYNAPVGIVSISTSPSIGNPNYPRTIGRIDWNGNVDTSTTTTAFDGVSPRSAASDNGANLWAVGGATGVIYTTFGSSGAPTVISTTVTNNRTVNIFNGQLYSSAGASSVRVGTVGTGLPTTSGQTISTLPGFPTSSGSRNGIFFADLSGAVAGLDTLYLADDGSAGSPQTATSGGVKKFSLVSGSWTYNGTFPAATSPVAIPGSTFIGLAGVVSGTTVTLYATRAGTQLVSFVDTTGYNAAPTAIPTQIAVPDDPDIVFRGVSFVPEAPPTIVTNTTGFDGNFGNVIAGTSSSPRSYTVSGNNLSSDITITAPASFEVGLTSGGTFSNSLSIAPASGTVSSTTIYVRFHPGSSGTAGGNVTNASSGATTQNIAVNGIGIQPGTLSFNAATYSGAENSGTISLIVTRSGGTDGAISAQATFSGGPATGGAACTTGIDYINTPITVNFAGGSVASQSVNVPICDDSIVEADETFTAALGSFTGGANGGVQTNAAVTITENDVVLPVVQLSSGTFSSPEGNTVSVTVTRTGDTNSSSSVDWAASPGSATAGTCGTPGPDFVAASGTVNFASGETSKTFDVEICSDFSTEPAETINLAISNPQGATLGNPMSATLSILDAATEFANMTSMTIAAGNPGAPYGTAVQVSSAIQSIAGIRLTLFGVTHSNPDDLDILLVGPLGQKFVFMADVGGNTLLNNNTITLEDIASVQLPDNSGISDGQNYRPAACAASGTAVDFDVPAPAGPYNQAGCASTGSTFSSVFGGQNPNGQWKLFVRDDAGDAFAPTGPGSIAGWGLQLIAPTAARSYITGRVNTPAGVGIRGAVLTLTGGTLTTPITAVTGTFGYYHFDEVPSGTSYVVTVQARRYAFAQPSRTVNVLDDIAAFDFVSEP
jgi:hypothetical protein